MQVVEAAGQPESLVSVTVATYSLLLDQLMQEVAEDVHRAAHTNTLDWISIPASLISPVDNSPASEPTLVEFPDRPESVWLEQVDCPHCSRRLAATRFAVHLEKCLLGKGRNSRGSKRVNYTE